MPKPLAYLGLALIVALFLLYAYEQGIAALLIPLGMPLLGIAIILGVGAAITIPDGWLRRRFFPTPHNPNYICPNCLSLRESRFIEGRNL